MDVGRVLIIVGALVLLLGVVVVLGAKMGLPLGRLPGDITYRGKNTVFYFPIVTSIVLSLLLTLILWVVGRFR